MQHVTKWAVFIPVIVLLIVIIIRSSGYKGWKTILLVAAAISFGMYIVLTPTDTIESWVVAAASILLAFLGVMQFERE